MDEVKKPEDHMTSAVAFMEGGIQEACDDACSICLEAFCESDPSTMTSCKHEFHLQCILEWCQRSSNCPMCWQPISLKDPSSQELFEGVEQERSFRNNPLRNSTIFHHPTLGDFELQHLPVGMNETELEERIVQHLAAAAAMRRAHHLARRDGSRSRSSSHGRSPYLVFSTHPNARPEGPASLAHTGVDSEPAASAGANLLIPLATVGSVSPQSQPPSSPDQTDQLPASGSIFVSTNSRGILNPNRSSTSESSLPNQDRAGPSDFQSLSENWKSRFNAMSMKYKDSISKSAKGWKDKLFSRSTSMGDISSEVRREVTAGIASVSRIMERVETRQNTRAVRVPFSNNLSDASVTAQSNHGNRNNYREAATSDGKSPACATSSVSD